MITQLAPDITRVLAPNASPMTYTGTNTYLLGSDALAIIDPGPVIDDHKAAILKAAAGRPIEAIVVTHAHVDHSPLAGPLGADTGAPVYAFGNARAGRSAVMEQLARAGLAGGGEGVDTGFAPDRTLADGEVLTGTDWRLEALWTPGHFGNHLCLASGDRLFCGDLVMGWASSLVSPPDGDLTDFMASCRRLAERDWSIFHPGHGDPIDDPAGRLAWLITHREAREAQILEAMTSPADLTTLTRAVYTDVDPALLPAAARNLFAHLVDLHGRGMVASDHALSEHAIFRKTG